MNGGELSFLRRRLTGWLVFRTGLVVAGIAGGAMLLALFLDAALDLPEVIRAAVPWLIVLCMLAIIAAGLLGWRQLSDFRAARMFEKSGRGLGNRLTNAVQLSTQAGATPAAEYLRREAVELGRRSAENLQAWPAMRPAVKQAAKLAGVVALVWICVAVFGWHLLESVWPRFSDPHGDHPPYSRVWIRVTPGRAAVIYGGQLEIRAQAGGLPVDKLWLVAASGGNSTRTVMFLAPDKSFFQTLANLREPVEYYVTDGNARSRKFPIDIRYTPQINAVEVTTVYPEYTAKPARTGKLSNEPQALPEGTTVKFRVTSNRPLKSGALELTPVLGGKPVQVTLQPEAQDKRIVAGSFTLAEATMFNLSVNDVDNLPSAEQRKGRFNILPDERPHLFVLEPGRDAVATPSIRIPVKVQAMDDYGVTKLLWLRGFNRSLDRPLSMKLNYKGGPASVEATGAFDLAKLGVRPGDAIEYYFEAVDNYPKGPNVTFSRSYRLEIISEEQFKEMVRQSAANKALFEPYFKLDGWLRRLGERSRQLENKAKSGSESDKQSLAQDAKDLATDLEKYQEQLDKFMLEPKMFDVEESFRESLDHQQMGLAEAQQQLRKMIAAGKTPGAGQLGDLAKKMSDLAKEEEQQVGEPAHQIAAAARLMARADEFVKLAKQEAEIARLLRRFADRTEPLSRTEQMEVQELSHQQQLVQKGLGNLMSGLEESLGELPADPAYDDLRKDVKNFTKAVADEKIPDYLTLASTFLGSMDAVNGHNAADSAATRMDKLIAKCNSMGKKPGQCMHFQPKIQQAIPGTLQQILSAMRGQTGSGEHGQSGYSLFNNDVGIYGPQMELAGEQAGAKRGGDNGSGSGRAGERLTANANDPSLPPPRAPGRVRLQTDAKFPLRYRELVGEYFRAIAESQNGEEQK